MGEKNEIRHWGVKISLSHTYTHTTVFFTPALESIETARLVLYSHVEVLWYSKSLTMYVQDTGSRILLW